MADSCPADRATIVVVGTGGLARAVCYSLATFCSVPARVVVFGRSAGRARELCYVANARAACAGRSEVRFEPSAGEFDAAAVAAVPELSGVLVCASTQSPWERLSEPSAWTALVQRAGFGLTLPFQAELALPAGRAIAGLRPRPWLVNACFPDAVNPLLAALGVPVLCGVGNIGLLAASVQAALGLPDERRVRMLAHHLHLHPPAASEEALAWLDERPVAGVGALLADQRAAARTELNQVTGHAAALLLDRLLAGAADVDTHLPGPLGLPGGYPLTLRHGQLALRLPPGVSQADAVAFNQRAAAADGVLVDGGRVVFGPAAAEELARLAPRLAEGFPVTQLSSATAELHALRTRLRGQPAEQEIPV